MICANCGAVVDSFSSVCRYCGNDLSEGGLVSEECQKLSKKLMAVDTASKGKRHEALSDFANRISQKTNLYVSTQKKIALIGDFVIPQTKNDILYFLFLAKSNIESLTKLSEKPGISSKEKVNYEALLDVWKTKYEQAIEQGSLFLESDPDFAKIKSKDEKEKRLAEEKKQKEKEEEKKSFLRYIIGMIVLIAIGFGILYFSEEKDKKSHNVPVGEPTYAVEISVECIPNLLMSKYDISLIVDDEDIGTIPHGEKKDFSVELTKGEHTVEFVSRKSSDVSGKDLINVNGDQKITYRLFCERDKIKAENLTPESETTTEETTVPQSETAENETENELPVSTNPETSAKPEQTYGNNDGNTVTVPDVIEEGDNLVWIPVNGGEKYHNKKSCSQMEDPIQVPLEQAVECGFEPCGICY